MPEGGYNWDKKKATKQGLRNIEKQAASYDLDQIVRAGQQDKDYKGGISSAGNVIADMSKKNQDFIKRNTKDGRMNSAALALLNSRWDDRSDYQRDLHKFIKSSPAAKDAYLERFPVGGRINLGIPAAMGALTKMAIPAPIRALGTIAKNVAGLGGRGLKAIVPEVIRKNLGFEYQKFKSNLPRLSPQQDELLNIQIEEGKGEDANITEQIKEGFDADTTWQDEMVKESGVDEIFRDIQPQQDIAYDPTKDIDTRTSGPNEVEDWMRNIQPKIGDALDVEEDIFDVSQNRMPHVPITQEQKRKIVAEVYGFDEADDYWVNKAYERAREQQDKGLEYGPWGDSYAWQPPGMSEIQDQIRWNTANQPLGTSYWEQPELNEEFIQENLKTGSDLWDFWDVGQQAEGGYLKKFDDGGYANMSTFEKLKAINDSIAEG